MKVAVIGSGVSGLAVAVRMAIRGYEVVVYEENDYPGGKLSQIQLGDYRFDAGPSVFTMPEYFEELFQLAGKRFQDYCNYERLEILTKYFYPDGTILNAYADKNKFVSEFEEKLGVPKETTLAYLEKSKTIYDITKDVFLNKSLHTLKQHSTWALAKASSKMHKIGLFKSMHTSNVSYFKNEQAVQYFDRFATYNGSNPYKAPSTLNVIPHLEHNIGAFFPKKGMFSLTQSLMQLGEELGVQYHLNSRVDSIIVEDKTAKGIVVKGEKVAADIVISGADVTTTYRKLLPSQNAPEKTLNQEKSSSALVFYWGINRKFEELLLHNIFFSKNYKAEFKSLFEIKSPYADPTIYINITSKHNSKDAPSNGENWFVMINAPNNQGQDWNKLIIECRKQIIAKLNTALKVDVEQFIEVESILDPRLIETKTSSHLGALYGNASNNRMAAFLRHANFSRKIKQLYFSGGSVHPGGGIPLCMLSAKIIDELID